EQFIVGLSGSATTGFQWEFDDASLGSVVRLTDHRYAVYQLPTPTPLPTPRTFVRPDGSLVVDASPNVPSVMVGTGGTDCWTFEAASVGTATLSMRYGRSWETVPPARTRAFTVIVRSLGAPAQIP